MCAVVMILSVYYVVATVPAAGTADQVTGVVTSQPIYSLTDATMGVGFMCPLVGFFVLDGTSTGLFLLGDASAGVGYAISLMVALVVFAVAGLSSSPACICGPQWLLL
jgi:hypothetical protein